MSSQAIETRSRKRPPHQELVTTFEFDDVAKLGLPPAVHATIAGGDRVAFDRITLRPRMLIPTLDLDLSVPLLGATHFAPILVGPVADQRRYHPDAELATVRGASAGRAAVIVSSRSSVPIDVIAAQAKTPLWYSVYADAPLRAREDVQRALGAGCTAVCITVGASSTGGAAASSPVDWKAIDQIRRGVAAPVVIKGVMTIAEAKTAIQQGVQGIVVSNHGDVTPAPIERLASIVDAVGGKAAVLVDGSFRRGTDILKALIFGAQGVLVARPVMWGLAGYGADGVQAIVELLQNDLARHMGAIGVSNLKGLTRNFVKIHSR